MRSNARPNLASSRFGPARAALFALAFSATLLAGGCQKLLRENVLATTQSMIGVTLAQNPGTQMYEFKAGFARNEFFLVPTGKTVHYAEGDWKAAGDEPPFANDADVTPEVLGEIQVGGKGKQGLGSGEQAGQIEVYQRLAVGKIAVQSRGAIALMSNDPATAASAAGAPIAREVTPDRGAILSRLNALDARAAGRTFKDPNDPTKSLNADQFRDALAKKVASVPDYINLRVTAPDEKLTEFANQFEAALNTP